MSIYISQDFDGGAIVAASAAHPEDISLMLRPDSSAKFLQWFYFRVQGAQAHECAIRILNAGQSTYPAGWEDYRAVASYDQQHWIRVPTDYDGQILTIRHAPERNSVYYAYFEPYSLIRHRSLLERAAACPHMQVECLGKTIEDRDIDLIVVGDERKRRKIWITARQHPGETMAEWFAEGMVDALRNSQNPMVRGLLAHAVFYIVPNMNPDGSVRGNLRTNAAGANLNREWLSPSLESSPEVWHVKRRIEKVGCDVFLDVHGDERLPYVFAAGGEMLDNFEAGKAAHQQRFIDCLAAASTEFRPTGCYPPGKYQKYGLELASTYMELAFDCVALMLEMPFKDNACAPNMRTGWSGGRSAKFGQQTLVALAAFDSLGF
ncbi:M14 family metallopeptidase [Noviherbaspirillum saxi]|uniref:Peptidase M14 domain-containing protein n=1 Tax=Noviherbaspirillum saxi TaxID=2320863 RepID=A0A3A3FU37_9BURK|nr:M14-type cytosolic carboxypeptidase [Noviherbaspirillum saxi]RJF99303.1 hypothetical protein D3871_12810 [Noviherbaspirillum saxi]